MQTATAWSTDKDSSQAINSALSSLSQKLSQAPDLILLYASELYDALILLQAIQQKYPSVKIAGCTSCLGVMTEAGFHQDDGYGLGLMGINMVGSSVGVGSALIEDDPENAATSAVSEAISNAQRPGELPDFVFLHAAPGCEEQILQGLKSYLGDHIPIQGGSSADNTVAGNWQQFANDEVIETGVVITVVYSDQPFFTAFHSGYEPTRHQGLVTAADGRTLMSIDYKPAAEVYNQWSGGEFTHYLPQGGNVLSATSLFPLGRVVGYTGAVPYYRLSHPDGIGADGSMRLFSEIEKGDVVSLMKGTKSSLLTRAGRVVQTALDQSKGDDEIAAALVVYCAGCMLTVKDDMQEVVNSINDSLDGKPFIGIFTFGEQGYFSGGENCHGNLMISASVWAK